MTYQEAVAYLESLSRFGSKLGLERMQKLAELLGNPQKDLKFLHIAGTNGKGSTVAMLSAILQAAGLQVGTFTSPHLSSFRERIAISNQPIPEEAVSRMVEELKPFADKIPELTKFEFFTALALRYFQEQKPDLVIFEVGMGGRL
ncbi:MAG TPA: bifunctional folylpolyglutamate synthase/dihydrofolate synthase, partial [Bacillota bacterium]|nr:bifunctional folylpolyglutamate synthase/dihydrofolate synthase [Bacillota bacterium]